MDRGGGCRSPTPIGYAKRSSTWAFRKDQFHFLQVIESHGEDFDELNVATAFHELAKVAKGDKDREELHSNETFLKLVGAPLTCLHPLFVTCPTPFIALPLLGIKENR